ncbi:hypothetical protein HCH15_10220 [Corynebacterium testudinoris]|uniref:hypothetical protein n=1 Tax=Corynebacterium testudinoris TaxID=136857 RepID=UPI001C8BC089|nr:hypothetical protein [Corynebacterium testudinoris]MBX8996553.1 hypothetical protein [Corynebacterium testudinoris]
MDIATYATDPDKEHHLDAARKTITTTATAQNDLVRAAKAAGDPETSSALGEMWSDTIDQPANVSKADDRAAEIAIATEQDTQASIESLDSLVSQMMARALSSSGHFFGIDRFIGEVQVCTLDYTPDITGHCLGRDTPKSGDWKSVAVDARTMEGFTDDQPSAVPEA